jgi:sugar lactone lactonase YvrE
MSATVDGLVPLADGFCFGEGPRWFEGLLWFSDMLDEAVHTVTPVADLTDVAPANLGDRVDAEPIGRRLTAFSIDEKSELTDRRNFADGLDGPPDGIALDTDGGIWASMTLAHQFERIVAGGEVTHRIDIGDRAAIACMLGGPERRTPFLLSTSATNPKHLIGTRLYRFDAVIVDAPGAGLP